MIVRGMATPDDLARLVSDITADIADRPLDRALQDHLNVTVPPGGDRYRRLVEVCRDGIAAGWLCQQGDARRRFGRLLQPSPSTHGFSVDVVEIDDLAGPPHVHPTGEIDLVMPVRGPATFDGHGAGWVVYPPGSRHRPTVADGQAMVLYLLPGGSIQWDEA